MQTDAQLHPSDPLRFSCVSDNVAFVMLGEVLRARSHELTEQLRKPSPDLGVARRLALTMHLSTENLVQDAGLVSRANRQSLYENQTNEPASLASVVDLCCVAARHRLRDMNIGLRIVHPPPDEVFLSGNPWETSYAFFFAIVRSGRCLAKMTNSSDKNDEILLNVRHDAQFADVSISSPVSLSPHNDDRRTSVIRTAALNEAEWHCLQQLAIKNDVHVSVQQWEQTAAAAYHTVFRLPTFTAGHE